MKVKDRLTPYPILSSFNDDYLDSSFRTDIEVIEEFNAVRVVVLFNLEDDVIAELIRDGKAKYVVHAECSATSYRHLSKSNVPHIEYTIPVTHLRDNLEICTFITTSDAIPNYQNPHFNPEYAGYSFPLEYGNLLAIGDAIDVKIQLNKEDLEDLPSIIRIHEIKGDSKDDGLIRVNLEDRKYIYIGLHHRFYEFYCKFGGQIFKNTFLTMIILPAMVEVLNKIKYAGDGRFDEGIRWYRVMMKMLEKAQISLDDLDDRAGCDIMTIAQKIFIDPIGNGMLELDSFINSSDWED